MHFLFRTAADKEIGHTVHALQVLTYFILKIRPIGSDGPGIVFPHLENDPDDRRRGGAGGVENRFFHIHRVGGDFIQLVRYPKKGVVHICAELEPEGHLSPAVEGGAFHLRQARDTLEHFFLLLDDIALDLIGGCAGPEGRHGDLGYRDRRAELVRHAVEPDEPEEHDDDDTHDHRDRLLYGKPDEIHYYFFFFFSFPC